MASHPTGLIDRDHPDYPAGIGDLADAPARIHVLGHLPREPAIAIVGARSATPYGLGVARRLAADLARIGFSIVSGLARGIDAAAHTGALDAGGSTVAVLPAGLDSVTPPSHRALAQRIAGAGAWLAEWPEGTDVRPWRFVHRNRLIAAFARATVVVEAGEGSGALATARAAEKLGRPLLAVPGDVDRPTSRGCLDLIRSGARLCADAADVLAALEPRAPRAECHAVTSARSAQPAVLGALGDEPATVESIAGRAGIGIEEAIAQLLPLEWAGLAVALPGSRWARRRAGARGQA